MKITYDLERKYYLACKVCLEKSKEEMTEEQKKFVIGCPYRCIDNEYCSTIERIEKEILLNEK